MGCVVGEDDGLLVGVGDITIVVDAVGLEDGTAVGQDDMSLEESLGGADNGFSVVGASVVGDRVGGTVGPFI